MLNFVLQRKIKKITKMFPDAKKIYFRDSLKGIAIIFDKCTLTESDLKKLREKNFNIIEVCNLENQLEIVVKPTLRLMTLLWTILVLEVLIFTFIIL